MQTLANLLQIASYLSSYSSSGSSGLFIGATEYAIKMDLNIFDEAYNVHKYYFYFKGSALRFPVSIRHASFIPPQGPFFDLYLAMCRHTSSEIELVSLDDDVFDYWIERSPQYGGYVFGGVEWLTEYYSNELTDPAMRKKDRYNPGGAAYCLRKIYDDIMNSAFPDIFLEGYIKYIRAIHKDEVSLQGIRIGNYTFQGELNVVWVTSGENFCFSPNQALVTMHTNMRYMERILQSKVLIVESKSQLSHAAVIAQELKIPCFLGVTDIYTKIFHGDIISIETQSQNIRIIKRFYEVI